MNTVRKHKDAARVDTGRHLFYHKNNTHQPSLNKKKKERTMRTRARPAVVLFYLLAGILFVSFLNACAITPHRLESGVMMKPGLSGADGKTALPINVRPGGKYVHVVYRNGTGHDFELRRIIEDEFMRRGMIIVDYPEESDYLVIANLTYLGYAKNYTQAPAVGKILGAAAGVGTGLGLAASGATNAGAAAGIGLGVGLIGMIIGDAIDRHNTPDIYIAEVALQIEERITFIGGKEDRRLLEKYTKTTVTTKSGKKTSVRSTETLTGTRTSPAETTSSTAQSGLGHSRSTTHIKVADRHLHQTVLYGRVNVLPDQMPTTQALDELKGYVSRSVAGQI